MDNTENNTELRKELIEYGFEKEHIDTALKISNKKEEAIEMIIKMIEDPNFYNETKAMSNLKCEDSNNEESFSNYKMVIMVRDDLKMGKGKIGAQVGHGVLGAYKMALNNYPQNVKNWEEYSGQAKIVVAVNSEEELLNLRDKAKEKGLPYYLVRDAGRTQVASGTITVCAVGPGRVKDIDTVTGHLELL